MAKSLFKYSGRFQWWSYNVSHGQLLLRSTKCPKRDTQIDVLFKDVLLVNMATSIDDIEVFEADEKDRPNDIQLVAGRKVFLVQGKNYSGFVVAAVVFHFEGEGCHSDPSPLIPRFPPITGQL